MTPEEKVALLKEAGVWDVIGFPSCIDKLFDLVAAHEKKFWMEQIEVECNEAVLAEREACAKVADGELMNTNMLTSYPPKSSAAWNIAAAIRARSKHG